MINSSAATYVTDATNLKHGVELYVPIIDGLNYVTATAALAEAHGAKVFAVAAYYDHLRIWRAKS